MRRLVHRAVHAWYALPGGRRLRGKVTGTCFAMLMILGSPHSMATNPVGAVAISVGLGTLVGLGATFRWRSWTWRSARRGPYAADADRVRALAERYRWMLHAAVPADRASAEAAIAWLTREAGLEPLPCVWVRSPREAALATMALRMYAADFDPVHGRSWLRVAGARPSGVEPAGWIRLVGMLETTLGPVSAGDPSDDERRSTALIDPPDPTTVVAGSLIARATELTGRFWFLDHAFDRHRALIAFALEDGGLGEWKVERPSGTPNSVRFLAAGELLRASTFSVVRDHRARAITTLIGASGGWWPTTVAVVLSQRPIMSRLDWSGRPHAPDGPALEYADGFRVYAEQGVAMPGIAFESPGTITIETIRAETNPVRRQRLVTAFGADRYLGVISASVEMIVAEPDISTRRMAIDRFGVTAFVKEAGTVIDSDLDRQGQMRRLWQAPRQGDNPIILVEVVNSTPEPDGSHRHHWLRVPPQIRRCQDAVAWTFGISPAAYEPTFES